MIVDEPQLQSDLQEQISFCLVRAVQNAALAAHQWVGKGDSHAADDAATEAMRREFSRAPFQIQVVIGEGERDQAPMLYRGEVLGQQARQLPLSSRLFPLDCAVDPCEGTSLVKNALPGAITVAVLSEKDGLVGAPDFYMEKLAAPAAAKGWVSIKQTPAERVKGLCMALGKRPEQLVIAVQERPRHTKLVQELQQAGARVELFREGDVSVALQCVLSNVSKRFDAMMGIGAAPEGVMTAAAFECLGGYFQGRFVYDPAEVMSGLIGTCKETNLQKLVQAGIVDPEKHYDGAELACGRSLFVAICGITTGEIVCGVQENQAGGGKHLTETLLLSSLQPAPRIIRELHLA